MNRYFHLFADRKTVREIDFETYKLYIEYNRLHIRKRMLCVLLEGEIHLRKSYGISVPLRQLKEVLSLGEENP